ncbi:pseudouridine synthase [Rhodobacter sp. Har01]|uniref:pseudouridine synthase n=1 Tax=Rhodobacter sp. Har01 TaxID=2883999 RepID=UPI001D098F71|nr:pseudouridine synthase [Rhodobacter sp. Har01]MCB6178170.1 pseudouridine synthase [Rhodobacter sp. Har01]
MAPNEKPPATPSPPGERIAKVLSRRGVASRREAERLIALGEVTVNGRVIDSPALNVTPRDRITISGHPLPAEEPPRLWLYYKPEGLVTSASDEKGRDTVFDHLPEDMPRVMSVGRLDLNSEGLLLLTNDGELKRKLELPSTGWLRKYRVRVNGTPTEAQLDPLRRGITVEGERFQPMQVTLDRVQGANAWLTVGLREGKNREIRRAMSAIDLYVNRLIRISYGPFRLNELQPGQVEEVRPRVLRDQLGESPAEAGEDAPKPRARRPAAAAKDAPAPRPRNPGDGIKALSKAWKAATTPRPGPRLRAEATGEDTPSRPTRGGRGPSAAAPAPRTPGKAAAGVTGKSGAGKSGAGRSAAAKSAAGAGDRPAGAGRGPKGAGQAPRPAAKAGAKAAAKAGAGRATERPAPGKPATVRPARDGGRTGAGPAGPKGRPRGKG